MLKAWLAGVIALLYESCFSVTPFCLCVTVLRPPEGSGVSFQVSSTQEPTVRTRLFVFISCNPTGSTSSQVKMTLCSISCILNDKTGSTGQMLTSFTPANTAISWMTAWATLMAWHKWKWPCNLGSVNSSVHDPLKRGKGKGVIDVIIIKHVLKLLNKCQKYWPRTNQIALPILGWQILNKLFPFHHCFSMSQFPH